MPSVVVNVAQSVERAPLSPAPSAAELRAKLPRRKLHTFLRRAMDVVALAGVAGATLRGEANRTKEAVVVALIVITFRRRKPSRSKTASPVV